MFPSGAPGIALLCLRISVCIALLLEVHDRTAVAVPGWLPPTAAALVLLLGVGLLTPIVCAICHCLALVWLLTGTGTSIGGDTQLALNALALGLLGPGAYSVDSLLFGRRIVVLRSDLDTDDSRDGERRPTQSR